jgi:uncharacterized protein YgbK (DUF1537 family)
MVQIASNPRPARLAFYGDDFTGSTDALEVLALAGLKCALFLKPPSPQELARLGRFEAVGVAGDSRAMQPHEMDEALPMVLQALATLAPIVHYKVCSTFDSAPQIGSIGRVVQIARTHLGCGTVPIVGGNPALGRYLLFGHLFARSGTDGKVYRIDRHPIMSVHPVTPMDEADLGVHLARQAPLSIARLTLAELEQTPQTLDATVAALLQPQPDALLIDGASTAHMAVVGRLLENEAGLRALVFVVGSSGVQHALTQRWPAEPGTAERFARFNAVDQVLAVSGSASKLTAMQINAALEAGFAGIAVNARELVDDSLWPQARQVLVASAVALLAQGRSVMVHTARGPQDPRIDDMIGALVAGGLTPEAARHEGGRRLGQRLGLVTRDILARMPLRRLLLSGGDTSSQVMQVLAPQALTVAARLAPGAPLCRLHAADAWLDGMEVALKGGQMGDVQFFERARHGNV